MATDTADATESPLANPLGALKGYFFQNNMNDPRVNSELRNRMAAAMLSQKKGYPKTVGEGLTAIGDALGDRAVLNQLAQADIAKQQQGTSVVPNVVPQAAAPSGVPAASAVLPPSVANANAAVPPDEAPQEPPAGPGATPFDPAVARNRISAMLAGGGQQPNPILVGGQDPSQQSTPNTQALLSQTPPTAPTVLSDVSKAPDVPLRPGTQLAQATTPYVMQKPVAPTPPAQVGMTKREIDAISAAQNYPNNEYVQQRAAAVLAQEKAVRDYEQARRVSQYNADLDIYKTRDAEYQRWLAASDTRALAQQKQPFELNKLAAETQKAMADAAAGRVPTIKDVNGTMMQFDPPSGKWIPVPTSGLDPNAAPNVKLTPEQSKSLIAYQWARPAIEALRDSDHLLATSPGQDLIARWGPDAMLNDKYRLAKTAADNFILAFMRSTSGAAYGEKEREDHARAMLPKYGDDAATLKFKAQQRENFLNAEYGALGPGQALAEFWQKQREIQQAADAAKAAAKPTASAPRPTIKMPDGSRQQLSADGTKWEPM